MVFQAIRRRMEETTVATLSRTAKPGLVIVAAWLATAMLDAVHCFATPQARELAFFVLLVLLWQQFKQP
jgi:hypothetical protein